MMRVIIVIIALVIGGISGYYFQKDTCLVIKKKSLICFRSLKSREDLNLFGLIKFYRTNDQVPVTINYKEKKISKRLKETGET